MRLGECATIRSGLVLARKESKPEAEMKFQYPLLTLRSIDARGYIERSEISAFEATEVLDADYLTRQREIIVRLSAPYTAVLIEKETEGMVVSSNFVIIRTHESKLLPEYLCWLLNTEKVRKNIFANTFSSMIATIKASYFVNLELSLPSVDRQRKIAAVCRLAQREIKLLRQLAEEKERYYGALLEAINAQKTIELDGRI